MYFGIRLKCSKRQLCQSFRIDAYVNRLVSQLFRLVRKSYGSSFEPVDNFLFTTCFGCNSGPWSVKATDRMYNLLQRRELGLICIALSAKGLCRILVEYEPRIVQPKAACRRSKFFGWLLIRSVKATAMNLPAALAFYKKVRAFSPIRLKPVS